MHTQLSLGKHRMLGLRSIGTDIIHLYGEVYKLIHVHVYTCMYMHRYMFIWLSIGAIHKAIRKGFTLAVEKLLHD